MAKGKRLWQPVVVEWTDIYVDRAAYDPDEYISNYKPCLRRTAGFYLGEHNGHVFTAEVDDRNAQTAEKSECINAFPTSVISRILWLDEVANPANTL